LKRIIIISLAFLLGLSSVSRACTIIMLSNNDVCLAGSNEDSVFPLTLIWFVPASQNEYARICMGYKMIFSSVQGGMNEKGLFVDGNSLTKQYWTSDENKKGLFGSILDRLLSSCANLQDVKEFFNTYNVPNLDRARIPVMDSSGASMIVEWYDGEVVFLETEKPYQIATNFVESKYIDKEKPCWRYNAATDVLDTASRFDTDILCQALDATHLDHETSTTVYSFICDLKSLDIYVYNFHDYSNPVKFNLKEEIGDKWRELYLGQIFTDPNPAYEQFIIDGPLKMVKRGYNNNMGNAMMFYNILKTNYPAAFNREIDENLLSRFGSILIEEGKLEDGITILENNTSNFPESDRVWFELANAYLQNNDKEKARDAYEKTLEINPEQTKAKEALEALK